MLLVQNALHSGLIEVEVLPITWHHLLGMRSILQIYTALVPWKAAESLIWGRGGPNAGAD